MTNEKKLVRISEGKMIAGVCTGLSRYFGMDVTLVRVIAVVTAIFGFSGVIAYLVVWLLAPMDEGVGV